MSFSFRFMIPKQNASKVNFSLFVSSYAPSKYISIPAFLFLFFFFLHITTISVTNFLKAIYPLGRNFEKWFLVSATASRVYFHLIIMKRENEIF